MRRKCVAFYDRNKPEFRYSRSQMFYKIGVLKKFRLTSILKSGSHLEEKLDLFA